MPFPSPQMASPQMASPRMPGPRLPTPQMHSPEMQSLRIHCNRAAYGLASNVMARVAYIAGVSGEIATACQRIAKDPELIPFRCLEPLRDIAVDVSGLSGSAKGVPSIWRMADRSAPERLAIGVAGDRK
jgi:hypothetical protein